MNIQSSSTTRISVDGLKCDWDQMHPLDRAKAIVSIRRSGISIRQIAKQVGRSEATLRHLLKTLLAPVQDLDLARQAALREAGCQKDREQQALAGSRLICDWLWQHLFSGPSGAQIVEEARRLLIEAYYDGTLPTIDLPDHPVTPAIIIERCKPKEPLDDSGTDIGWYGKWFARWVVFAFSDPEVRDDALDKALQQQWRKPAGRRPQPALLSASGTSKLPLPACPDGLVATSPTSHNAFLLF